MNILHYTLGLPPYRTGGLTKYATDLMAQQVKSGNNVSVLYPGDFIPWNFTKTYIKEKRYSQIAAYEIKNPSPVPLFYGIKNPLDIVAPKRDLSKEQLEILYKKTNPAVFHIHTLMGLPLELLRFFKYKGVKLIYTTHDYYGLCPKVNFINYQGQICETPDDLRCSICNKYSPNSLFLELRNSSYVMKYKKFLTQIAKTKSTQTQSNIIISEEHYPSNAEILCYKNLLLHYKELFSTIDLFHFNSSVAEAVYKRNYKIKNSVILPITHADITDNRKSKGIDSSKIKFGFIGNRSDYKGFPLLKKALLALAKEGHSNWDLSVWGNGKLFTDPDCSQIYYKGTYTQSEQYKVFDIDLLIVPSIWKETFSLITLEAISYGVPVLVTSNVGAKDLVSKYNSEFIIQPDEKSLSTILKRILCNPEVLKSYNEKIKSGTFNYTINNHEQELKKIYEKLVSDENSDSRYPRNSQ